MKFLSVIPLSLAAVIVGTVRAVPEVLIPTESPGSSMGLSYLGVLSIGSIPSYSEAPYSEAPYDYTGTSSPRCPDTHSDVVKKLNQVFRKTNCVVDNDDNNIYCSLEVPGWFTASAYYEYKDKTGKGLQPSYLEVIDSYSCYGCSSLLQSTYFDRGECLFGDFLEGQLNGIQYRRKNPDEAPTESPGSSSGPAYLEAPYSEAPHSEAPYSEAPYSEAPYDYTGTSSPRCPDTHSDVVKKLNQVFRKTNCVVDNDDNNIYCSLEVPGWFTASAYYEYKDKTGKGLQPSYLEVIDSYSCYDCSSFLQSTYFDGGECLFGDYSLEGQLNGIQYRRKNPDEAPVGACENAAEPFLYNRGREETSCNEVAARRFNSIQRVCNKHGEIATNCPGLCNKDECPCENNPVTFSLDRNGSKTFSCDRLAGMNDEKKWKKCGNKIIVGNCPGLCVEECLEA
jgi:hypothetical protein